MNERLRDEKQWISSNGDNKDFVPDVTSDHSPDISLSSGPIEPLDTEKDSGSEPDSSQNELTPTHLFSLKEGHDWLKHHLKRTALEKNKLEEIAAKLNEKTERLQYELADVREAAKSKDEVIKLLQDQLHRMEVAYSKSLEESVQNRLQLSSNEQEISHLKEICHMYEEEKNVEVNEEKEIEKVEGRGIKKLEHEKEELKEEIIGLQHEKCNLIKKVKELTKTEIISPEPQTLKDRYQGDQFKGKSDDTHQETTLFFFKNAREIKLEEQNLELEQKLIKMNAEFLQLTLTLKRLIDELEFSKKKEIRESQKAVYSDKAVTYECLECKFKKFSNEFRETEAEEKGNEISFSSKISINSQNKKVREVEPKLEQGFPSNLVTLKNLKLSSEKSKKIPITMSTSVTKLEENNNHGQTESEETNALKKSDSEDERMCKKRFLEVTQKNERIDNEILDLKSKLNILGISLAAKTNEMAIQKNGELISDEVTKVRGNNYKAPRKKSDENKGKENRGKSKGKIKWKIQRETKYLENLQLLKLKKEILFLQNIIVQERKQRECLESRIYALTSDVRNKEKLEKEISSLKKIINRDCLSKSDMELIWYEKQLRGRKGNNLEESEKNRLCQYEIYRDKCKRLVEEKEKSKGEFFCGKGKEVDGPRILETEHVLIPDVYRSHRHSSTSLPFHTFPKTIVLEDSQKKILEQELSRSIRKFKEEQFKGSTKSEEFLSSINILSESKLSNKKLFENKNL